VNWSNACENRFLFLSVIPDLILNPVDIIWIPAFAGMTKECGMLTRKQKQELIENLSDKFGEAKSSVFADYRSLSVAQMKELRRKLKAVGAEFKVAKKTLFDLAVKKAKLDNVSTKKMDGQIAVAFGLDEVSAAKALGDFAKKNEGLKILGAILEGKFLEKNAAVALAKVPTREQSLAMLIGALQGNLRSLVYVLSEIKK